MTTTDRWPMRAATRLSSESGARPGTASDGVMSDAQLGWELCIVGHEVAVKVQVHEQDPGDKETVTPKEASTVDACSDAAGGPTKPPGWLSS